MWTVWGSDSAIRFRALLSSSPQLAPLVRALVVDRVPHPKPSESDTPADMLDAIQHDTDRMVEAGFTVVTANGDIHAPPDSSGKPESMHLFELALALIEQCPLLQRFFLLALPGYWTNMMGTADPIKIEEQQLRLVAALAKLDQLVVAGLWDEANIQPVQLSFASFRRLLETGPPKLRNISWPIEGPLEEGDLVWGADDDDDVPRPLAATDARSARAKDEDLSPLPSRTITDVQLTLFHLSLQHYQLIARALYPGVKRVVLDISSSPACVPKPEVMRELFDDRHFGEHLEWYSADVACLPASSNPLTLGVRPRFPLLCLNHDGGVYSTAGKGPLGDSDRERFTALKDNSIIHKGFVWKRRELEKVLGPLEELLPGVELVDL